MEVVLSPGRFGDEVPGAPFQNEEIREWSHVDRLTGMLERARVETGRWKTLNQGAARSYGKVIDSRERNSADGSVVQRARRQVEVFQSEGPGRSVQVVRASQWSSSRVTDSSTTSPLAVTSLAQKKNGAATPERLVASSRLNKLSPSSSLCRDEAISERLSTLLGSFAHHTSSSTVPFRRIDSKYASRTPISLPISKRSTSSEDLTGHNSTHSNGLPTATKSLRDFKYPSYQEIKNKPKDSQHIQESSLINTDDCAHSNGFPTATKSLRDFKYPSYQEIKNKPKDSQHIQESSLINADDCVRHKVHEISVEREGSRDYAERPKVHEISVEQEEPRDYNERIRDCEDSGAILENSQSAIAIEEPRTATNKAAIQLLPSSKANTTVVHLINDSSNSQTETMDTREGKHANIYSWILPSSIVGDEAVARVETEEAATSTTAATTATTTTVASSRRDPRVEELTTSLPAAKSVKRVGFCKTEIHFAADSGKVNIVETDGKPPPTNKFRRRRRNSLTGVASGKPPAIEKTPVVETKDSLAEDGKTRTDPNLHRGHTTTVNLGSGIADLATKSERPNRGFPEGRQQVNFPGASETTIRGIQLRLENRIYDRLESYSSEQLLLDSGVSSVSQASPSKINLHQSALKSARLVMNLTKVPGSGCVTKIVIDNDVTRSWTERNFSQHEENNSQDDRLLPAEARDDFRMKAQEDLGRYLDWQADHEVQCIMLGSSSLTNRTARGSQAPELFPSPTAAKEPENVHETSDTPRIENLAPSEAIVESTEEVNSTPHSAPAAVDSAHDTSKNACNVVCTDAENNQVLLKVVTTHEPTIARVESDHLRKKIVKSGGNPPVAARKEKRSSKCPASSVRKLESHKEHTYVNVFTGSKRAPIYENYKPIESTAENKIGATSTTDANSGAEKSAYATETKTQGSQSSSCNVLKSREIDNSNFDRVKAAGSNAAGSLPSAAPVAEGKLSSGTESDRLLVGSEKARNKIKETKPRRTEGSSCNVTSHSAASSRGRVGKQVTKNSTPRSSVSSSERGSRNAAGNSLHASGNNTSVSKSSRDVASAKTTNKADALTKQKPIEVVYQTAVYNMKNEKLKKPPKGKESKGPRYLNELICGAKMKRPSDSKSGKTSSATQHGANNKSALPPIKHWK